MSKRFGDCRFCRGTGSIESHLGILSGIEFTALVECGICSGTGLSGDAMNTADTEARDNAKWAKVPAEEGESHE